MKSGVQLNLRARESQRILIDTAAEILHKSRTDFILEMACKAAEDVILDRRVFNFNDRQYEEFTYRKLKNQSIPLSTPYAT